MWTVLGQERMVQALKQSLREGTLAHAYLIVGPPHSGKATLARDLAQAVNCEAVPHERPCGVCRQCQRIASGRHADVTTLAVEEAEGHKAIRLEQVKEALRAASLQPYEGAWRVFILDGAEYLNDPAANALLKTLEEPPPRVLWLLLAADEEALPATIRSRCQRLALRPMPADQMAQALQDRWAASLEQAQLLERLAKGALGWAVLALSDSGILETRTRTLDRLAGLVGASFEERFRYATELATLVPRERTALRDTLDLWASWWRDILMLTTGTPEAVWNHDRTAELREFAARYQPAEAAAFVQLLLQTKRLLELNVNPRLALEHLMLGLPAGTEAETLSGANVGGQR
ncbi:MAG: DNA polymerase III subunit delta' [Dehalococcoidia bacterium]|nr:DNA polymerase III subunit delta' [Dehalococcoidia bacterium]